VPRATICIDTDDPAKRLQVESWLLRWRDALGKDTENIGCGCCIDMYDVDAPWEAVRELPEEFFALSDWAERPSLNMPTK
jgi:hypothetical protein